MLSMARTLCFFGYLKVARLQGDELSNQRKSARFWASLPWHFNNDQWRQIQKFIEISDSCPTAICAGRNGIGAVAFQSGELIAFHVDQNESVLAPTEITKQLGQGNDINETQATSIAVDGEGSIFYCSESRKLMRWSPFREKDGALSVEELLVGIEIKKISCGVHHCAAVDADGSIYTWASSEGAALHGQLGRDGSQSVVTKVELSAKALDCACGDWHTVVIDSDRNVWSFGSDKWLQLGHGNPASNAHVLPRKVLALQGAGRAVACGAGHTVVTTTDDRVLVCGRGGEGQLGLDYKPFASGWKQTTALPRGKVLSVAAGGNCSAAVVVDSTRQARIWWFGDGCLPARPVEIAGAGQGLEHLIECYQNQQEVAEVSIASGVKSGVGLAMAMVSAKTGLGLEKCNACELRRILIAAAAAAAVEKH